MLKKIKYQVSYEDEINTEDFDPDYTDEDILQECRLMAMEVINAAAEQDVANITTEFIGIAEPA